MCGFVPFACIVNLLDQFGAWLTGNATVIAVVVAALATCCIAWFTIILTRVSSRQADLMVASQRAFVYCTSISPEWEINNTTGEYDWKFRPTWHNSGDTPTKRLLMHTNSLLLDAPLRRDTLLVYPTSQVGTGLLGPKATGTGGGAPLGKAITPNDILEMQAGLAFLYVFGWARYSDVFPNTRPHITRFCYQMLVGGNPKTYSPAQIPGQPGFLLFKSLHVGPGNCADEECELIGAG